MGELGSRFSFERLEPRVLMHADGELSYFDATLNAIVHPHEGLIVPIEANSFGGIVTNAGFTAQRGSPNAMGQWSGPTVIGGTAIHASLLPSGRVLWWDFNVAREMNASTLTVTGSSIPGYTVFCAGHSFLPDGRLLVTGGQGASNDDGLVNASIYDPITRAWTRVADMYQRRWYPTNTTLANGDILVLSGRFIAGYQGSNPIYDVADMPQVWNHQTSSWRNLTTALRDQWLYPWMFLAPDGRVFDAGPGRSSAWLNTSGTGQWSAGPASIYGDRDYGTAVMYRPGKILIAGGSRLSTQAPTATAEIIDLNQPNPAWQSTGSMQIGRRQTIGTVLADGTVLVTGGTRASGFNVAGVSGTDMSVYDAELWNPDTNQWTTLAQMAVRRIYHSTALLLPDARVLVMGSGQPAGTGPINGGNDFNHTDAEIFSPPYLFNGARPTITAAPGAIDYGQQFSISTPDAANISKVTLVRLGSMTHDINMEQRLDVLNFSAGAGSTLNISAPTNPNLMPPGPYMLFVMNNQGVPSVAAMMTLNPAVAPNVTASSFLYNASPHRLSFKFDQNVTSSLGLEDIIVQRLPSGPNISPSALAFDASANTATFSFSGVLGNGNYRATLLASGIGGPVPMSSNYLFDFHFFVGDADNNSVVNFDDYARIDTGFNRGLTGFSNCDFNYDGVINFDDYALIDLAFNSQGSSRRLSFGLVGGTTSKLGIAWR
ncbi:hypothetical protein BH09PLA1_BH09PLA1_28300 [soil metagenome]